MKNRLVLGDWNAICDSCGRKFKASQLMKRWDGLMVCQQDFESRHPQQLIQIPTDDSNIEWSRHESEATGTISVSYLEQETGSVIELALTSELEIILETET